ncbi:MAG TPA: phosphoadenylyl-sulfate reductase [Candidatus Deferrimicrobiaceae bacterium]|nr:phosphoadenylyl-sulfate reductase [Candidatus Deferrimicrobiaceae bacterium]
MRSSRAGEREKKLNTSTGRAVLLVERFRGKPTENMLAWALSEHHPHIALASSFSMEDIALIAMMTDIRPDARVFALDTGRLDEETYEAAEAVRRDLGVSIEWHFPDREAVELLERTKGLYSFRESLKNRRECCRIRKVEPLARALSGLRAWVTGQRKDQSITRAALPVLEIDGAHGGILKINPLADWSDEQVRSFVRMRGLPYNRLHDMGYPSNGCAPCTRAILHGEDPRAGRWWWENPEHKECGLHQSSHGADRKEPPVPLRGSKKRDR